MNAQALAITPIFMISLMVCASVAAYGFYAFIKGLSRKVSNTSLATGLSPQEVKAIKLAGTYHTMLEELLTRVVAIEQLSSETPAPFNDHSWRRLLELCDDLECWRSELNILIGNHDYYNALLLGRFLCGLSADVPKINPTEPSLEPHKILFWQRQTRELMLRMVSKLADSTRYGTGGNTNPLTPTYHETLEALKGELNEVVE
jgi:hypothetical protein